MSDVARGILWAFLVLSLWFAVSCWLTAAEPFPDLNGRCSYGSVIQSGPVLTIRGCWSGNGNVQADGQTVQIMWTPGESDRMAWGVYVWGDGKLVGNWAWLDEIEILPSGAWLGPKNPEIIEITRD